MIPDTLPQVSDVVGKELNLLTVLGALVIGGIVAIANWRKSKPPPLDGERVERDYFEPEEEVENN